MPFRYTLARAVLIVRSDSSQCLWRPPRRWFHATRGLQDDVDSKNHYETLNLHPDATPRDIKKSFYTLSKAHHPDHNPADPHASRRFMRISEAYSVLGHTEKRARYDRDVMRRHHNHGGQAPHRATSYHSTGPAGGRPPSGLSRRRGTFTGPPPSFFRSGGWGAQSAKRRSSHEDSTGGGARMGGMGPGQDPYGHKDDVPHFDHKSHERTHRRGDERRARRRRDGEPFPGSETGVAGMFFVVSGVLLTAVLLPYLAVGGWRQVKRQGKEGAEIGHGDKNAKHA